MFRWIRKLANFLGRPWLAAKPRKKMRVLVVDDYEPFRNLVSSLLEDELDLQVIGEAADGWESIQKTVELKPDLIALDVGLPGLNGIEVARQLRGLQPRSKILFLSEVHELAVVREALGVGQGFVLKSYLIDELTDAVNAVLAGGRFVSARFRDQLDQD